MPGDKYLLENILESQAQDILICSVLFMLPFLAR